MSKSRLTSLLPVTDPPKMTPIIPAASKAMGIPLNDETYASPASQYFPYTRSVAPLAAANAGRLGSWPVLVFRSAGFGTSPQSASIIIARASQADESSAGLL